MKELRDDKKISSYWTDDGKIFLTLPENPNKKSSLCLSVQMTFLVTNLKSVS